MSDKYDNPGYCNLPLSEEKVGWVYRMQELIDSMRISKNEQINASNTTDSEIKTRFTE